MKYKIQRCFVFIFSLLLIGSIQGQNVSYQVNSNKMNQLLRSINNLYVDTVNFTDLVEVGIIEMLKELDPHSVYIPAKEVQQMNEPLQGAFDGIGVSFQIIKDTITIVEVLVGGPSEKVGLMVGDKILKVDSSDATGKKVNNRWVQEHLRGKKGTKVNVLIKRGRSQTPLEFTITRDKIPMNSINVSFMVDKKTGYIKLERFAQTSPDEFDVAMTKLKARGLENLILDLRGNGGGYLDVAFKISNQFIKAGEMIVYTDNFRGQRQEFLADGKGSFKKGKLIVLVDENSASASEIVSGAVQDWDRGLIMGRRTFGKGLVQKPFYLADTSMVRLTTHYYYTPTGRCIQKPYNDGLEKYYQDLNNRYKHGEYLTADSISFPDSLKYLTPNQRTVYGGGGIMPDIFMPIDTTKYSTLFNELVRKGVFGGFTMNYMESNRQKFLAEYPTIEDFKNNFEVSDELYEQLMDYAKKEGVKDTVPLNLSSRISAFAKDKKAEIDSLYTNYDDVAYNEAFEKMLFDYIQETYNTAVKNRNMDRAPEFIKEYLKFDIARNMFNYGEAYQIFLMSDDVFLQAVELIEDNKVFKKFKVSH